MECGDIAAYYVDVHNHFFRQETGFKKWRSTKKEGRRKPECSNDETPGSERFLSFGFRHSFGIRCSSFVIAPSLKVSWCEPAD